MAFLGSFTTGFKTAVSSAVKTVSQAVSSVVSKPTVSIPKTISTAPKTISTTVTTANTALVKATPALVATGLTIASPSTAGKIAWSTAKTVAKNPLLSLATVVGVPTVIKSTKAKETLVNTAINLPSTIDKSSTKGAKALDNPNPENIKEVLTDPLLLTTGTLLGLGVIGGKVLPTAINAYATTKEKDINITLPETKMPGTVITPTTPEKMTTPAILPTKESGTTPVPITPQTQILGKSAGVTTYKRPKTRKKSVPSNQNVRVNIYNQTKSLYTHSHLRC